MSGGSWDYAFNRFDDVADRLAEESDPLRRLMAKRVALLAKALHDIEWIDSGDYSDGKEVGLSRRFSMPILAIRLWTRLTRSRLRLKLILMRSLSLSIPPPTVKNNHQQKPITVLSLLSDLVTHANCS
jgi:hypothetical protein